MIKIPKNNSKIAACLLRIGLAVVLLYASISSFKNPQDWTGYLPSFVRTTRLAVPLLHLFSVYELLLVVWLVSGKFIRYAAWLYALTFSGIVVVNFSLFAISFRDIALIFAALALSFL